MNQRAIIIAAATAVGATFSLGTLSLVSEPANARPMTAVRLAKDNAELATLSQDAKQRAAEGRTDGFDRIVRRVRDIIAGGNIRTGADYYNAATVLHRGEKVDDFLSAHEMAVAALALGETRARWLAAASQDRYLVAIGRPQRFGTQYAAASGGEAAGLRETTEGISDNLRRVMGVPAIGTSHSQRTVLRRGHSWRGMGEKPTIIPVRSIP
jgi:hypothetical protein